MLKPKQLTVASCTRGVLPDLPQFARPGLFAKTSSFKVSARLSNDGLDRAAHARRTAFAARPAARAQGCLFHEPEGVYGGLSKASHATPQNSSAKHHQSPVTGFFS